MEKLNGLAKKHFLKWYHNRLSVITHSELVNINDETIYNALIIEWFDTLGYYILPCTKFQFGYFLVIDGDNYPIRESHGFKNRKDALDAGIKDCVVFYNIQECSINL